MNLFENLSQLNDLEKRTKVESNNELYSKFNNHYNGFVSLQDLMNYCSLDQFGELVQFCKKEADLDYDYEKRYSNWDEALDDLNRIYIYDDNDIDAISTENIFNFFSTNELEDFWNWVETEYDLNYVEESNNSKKIEEVYRNDKGSYTLNFGHWRSGNGLSFKSESKLISWLRSNYIDLDTQITYSENVTNTFKNVMNKIHHSDIHNQTARKNLFDRGYVAITDAQENPIEESIKLDENVNYEEYINTLGYIKNMIEGLEVVINNYDSTTIPKQIVQFINKLTYIAEDVEEFLAKDNDSDSIEEATSGIGAGAYTTKAIDILPNNTAKPKKIKLESNATFYGNVFSDEELIKGLEYSKEHASEWMFNDDVYESIRYEDKDYWIVAYSPEDENILFDNKPCIVALVIDEAINKYLAYFEIKYIAYSDGDPENGMKAPEWTIDNPFKIVELQ